MEFSEARPKPSAKPKILIVDNSRGFTGAYKSISSSTTALSTQFEFFFCLPWNSDLRKSAAERSNTVTLPFLEVRRNLNVVFYLPLLFINSVRLLLYIKRNKIDILHINDLYNMVGVIVKLLHPDLKVVYHVRLMPDSYSGPLYKAWLSLVERYADKIICVSRAVRENVKTNTNVVVIHDGISSDMTSENTNCDARGETIQLLYLANYTNGKGHDLAIKAFAEALKANTSLRLVLVGGDLGLKKNQKYKKALASLASFHNVSEKVEFRDFETDTSSLYKEADIFLNFSRSESFSMTCLEALMHGVPVIATNSGGPAEILEPACGVIVPVDDINAMTEAICTLSSDRALMRRMGECARLRAKQRFDLSITSKGLRDVYLAILSHDPKVSM